jgi:hypothetical protein
MPLILFEFDGQPVTASVTIRDLHRLVKNETSIKIFNLIDPDELDAEFHWTKELLALFRDLLSPNAVRIFETIMQSKGAWIEGHELAAKTKIKPFEIRGAFSSFPAAMRKAGAPELPFQTQRGTREGKSIKRYRATLDALEAFKLLG